MEKSGRARTIDRATRGVMPHQPCSEIADTATIVELMSSRIKQETIRAEHQPQMGDDTVVVSSVPAQPIARGGRDGFALPEPASDDRSGTGCRQRCLPHAAGK